jgi:hypothetical protein
MVLDTEIMLWYPPSVSGQVPSGRSGHTASLLQSSNELVVFGGVKNGKWLNSVSVLDTARWNWSTPKIAGDAPRPRSYHSATSLSCTDEEGSRIVIFGGNNDTKCFNCVHVLEQVNGKMSWSHPKMKGKTPSPRTGHTATLLEDGYTIMVYGGWDPNMEDEKGDDLIFGDSFLLDTKTWTWSKGPKPRYASFNGAASNGGLERVGHWHLGEMECKSLLLVVDCQMGLQLISRVYCLLLCRCKERCHRGESLRRKANCIYILIRLHYSHLFTISTMEMAVGIIA